MSYLEKIKTYLILSDETNVYGSNDGTPIQSYVYGIDQFNIPGVTIYNPTSLYPVNNELTFSITECFFNRTIDDVFNLFESGRKYISFTVVKFWGKVSQEFTFTGTTMVYRNDNKFSFKWDSQSFSEKNDRPKVWTGVLIPFIRDEKLSKILGDI